MRDKWQLKIKVENFQNRNRRNDRVNKIAKEEKKKVN